MLILPNVLLQKLHENFLIFRCWISIWSFKCPFVLYVLLQWGHWKGLCSEWNLWCVFKFPFSLKAFPHSLQMKGFFPVYLHNKINNWYMNASVDLKTGPNWIGFIAIWVRTFVRTHVLMDCEHMVSEVAWGGEDFSAFSAEIDVLRGNEFDLKRRWLGGGLSIHFKSNL